MDIEHYPCPGTDPEFAYIEQEVSRKLWLMIISLPPLHQSVINRVYFQRDTLQCIADDYGCSREYIRQIKQKALKKLKLFKNIKELI